MSLVPVISPQEVYNILVNKSENLKFIDVRTSDEFFGELGHIKKSQLATLGAPLTALLVQGHRDEKIVFVCRSGRRSEAATLEAINLGYVKVFNMSGGMILWNELKYEIEK